MANLYGTRTSRRAFEELVLDLCPRNSLPHSICNYAVHELDTLTILEAFLKWEDKLIGYHIHVITDHKDLEFFKTQAHLSNQQQRWMDYMSRFNFNITYVKGELNKVADCLSRYYENDIHVDIHNVHNYV